MTDRQHEPAIVRLALSGKISLKAYAVLEFTGCLGDLGLGDRHAVFFNSNTAEDWADKMQREHGGVDNWWEVHAVDFLPDRWTDVPPEEIVNEL